MGDIAALVLDAAPGEIDAVRRDIEVFSDGSSSVKTRLEQETRKANISQFRVVEVAGQLTILSEYNQLDDTTFFTHGSTPKKFTVDHLSRKTTVLGPYEPEQASDGRETESVQKQVDQYAKQHYEGEYVAAVFPKASEELAVVIVGRRLSPANFHNGQITAVYTLANGTQLKGKITTDVHCFEDGNVRLKSTHPVSSNVNGDLGETLRTVENEFEAQLNKTLVGLNEREFKSLRRQLPVTRQPMMWGKAVAGYSLGKELENR